MVAAIEDLAAMAWVATAIEVMVSVIPVSDLVGKGLRVTT